MEKYIITGGPCVGKTKVLEGLKKLKQVTVPEAARAIIEEEERKEREIPNYQGILPQTKLIEFEEQVIARQLQQEQRIPSSAKVFLDRSLADIVAYFELGNVTPPSHLYKLIEEADYTKVFFLDRLAFYKQEKERKEDSEYAKRIHEKLYRVYDRLGFDIVMVPVFHPEEEANIEARVKLILSEAQSKKNREIERKYRVGHSQVKEMLDQYAVNYVGTDNEKNTLYDFCDVLKDLGCVFRIRENNDEHILTIKGPNKSKKFTDKPEYNFSIPQGLSSALDTILPASLSYLKQRKNYRPLGDAQCTISLDYLPELDQEFVEIEAGTENQVFLWEKRLGLAEYAINKSYPALVREHENANSR